MSGRSVPHASVKLRASSSGFAVDRFARQQAARATILEETQWRPYALCRKLAALASSTDEIGAGLCAQTVDTMTLREIVCIGQQLRAISRELSKCADSISEQITEMVSASLASCGSSEISGNGPMLQLPAVMKAQQNLHAAPLDAADAEPAEDVEDAACAEIRNLEDLFGDRPADVK